MRRPHLLALFALIFSGCQEQHLSQQDTKLIGPVPVNYQGQIEDWFNLNLKDPYSAHYQFSEIVPTRMWTGLLYYGWLDGWACEVIVNAKNSFGAYDGNEAYDFVFVDGSIKWVGIPKPQE